MITEKEAPRTRCCVTGCGDADPAMSSAMLRSMRFQVDRFCVGSKCMGWRWCEPLIDGPDSYQSEPGPKGYCGVAGMPE